MTRTHTRTSRLSHSDQGENHIYVSGATTGGGGTDIGTTRTFISTGANEVAIVDRVDITIMLLDQAAADTLVTMTINSQTMKFTGRCTTGRTRKAQYTLKPKGTMWVNPSSTMTIVCGTAGYVGQAFVRYRKMSVGRAIELGYRVSQFLCASSGTISGAGTPQSMIAASTVTANRCIEINGIAITGTLPTATSASQLEILLEFTNESAIHRKIIKNCYGDSDPESGNPLIINDCVIRGPKGYGLRVTAGATGASVQASVWGRYVDCPTSSTSTFPGTGVVPGATDALDTGDYFWVFSDRVTNGLDEIFPATTCATKSGTYVIDGYAAAMSVTKSGSGTFGLVDTNSKCYTPLIVGLGAAGGGTVAGCQVHVYEDLDLRFRLKDRIGLATVVLGGTIGQAGQLVWGRCGGPGLSDTHITKRYAGGT